MHITSKQKSGGGLHKLFFRFKKRDSLKNRFSVMQNRIKFLKRENCNWIVEKYVVLPSIALFQKHYWASYEIFVWFIWYDLYVIRKIWFICASYVNYYMWFIVIVCDGLYDVLWWFIIDSCDLYVMIYIWWFICWYMMICMKI